MISRKLLRRYTFEALFAYDFYEADALPEQTDAFLETEVEEEEARAMIRERVIDACSRIPDIDKEINDLTEGWTTARMNKVDLTIIRLAIYEMRFDPETPVKVAIDEAVELAKEFGGDESPRFVNGVLAKFAKEDS